MISPAVEVTRSAIFPVKLLGLGVGSVGGGLGLGALVLGLAGVLVLGLAGAATATSGTS